MKKIVWLMLLVLVGSASADEFVKDPTGNITIIIAWEHAPENDKQLKEVIKKVISKFSKTVLFFESSDKKFVFFEEGLGIGTLLRKEKPIHRATSAQKLMHRYGDIRGADDMKIFNHMEKAFNTAIQGIEEKNKTKICKNLGIFLSDSQKRTNIAVEKISGYKGKNLVKIMTYGAEHFPSSFEKNHPEINLIRLYKGDKNQGLDMYNNNCI